MTHAARMARFAEGHWTKERPTSPGCYLVRSLSGTAAPSGSVVALWANDIAGGGSVVCPANASHDEFAPTIGHNRCRIMLSTPWLDEFWSVPWPGGPEGSR